MASDRTATALKGERSEGHSRVKNGACQSRDLLPVMKNILCCLSSKLSQNQKHFSVGRLFVFLILFHSGCEKSPFSRCLSQKEAPSRTWRPHMS